MPTTDCYWSVIPDDGVEYDLSNWAYNIETWGGSRQSPVPLRGEDTRIAWVVGEQETDRVPDARTIGLSMWVRGATNTGEVPDGNQARVRFDRNWMLLKRILHNQGRILTLRKRFYDEAGVFRQADARARWADGLEPSMLGRMGARFVVDFRLADPYFYGTAVNVALDTAVGVVTPTILGDADVRKLSFSGTTKATGMSNMTLDDLQSGHTFNLNKSNAASESLVIDYVGQTARLNSVNLSGLVTHSGSNDWFRLRPGANQLTPSSSTGGWSGNLTYYPTWN
jgi:hypothetical protein